MEPSLEKYRNMKICAAVSGGKDSMALLHYLHTHAKEYSITLSALNCDHKIRGEASARDSAFVREYCRTNAIPLLFFEYGGSGKLTEESAREWRFGCYITATKAGTASGKDFEPADAVATAHHLNDNAETVLFNLARGSGLAGACGITDTFWKSDGGCCAIIHPLITVTREEIDRYIEENGIPYVTDETNFSTDYTRNKIRRNVLPALEDAVHGAAGALFRFSRIAKETEDYFDRLIEQNGIICDIYGGQLIKFTPEKAVFERAALKVFATMRLKDYTALHIDRLFGLQSAENGRRFEFLGLTALKESKGISICRQGARHSASVPYADVYQSGVSLSGEYVYIGNSSGCEGNTERLSAIKSGIGGRVAKALMFDPAKIPADAVVRFRQEGDTFTRFGGGSKKLNDWFTDIKLPVRLRDSVPLVASGSEVLIACGIEISEKVKVTDITGELGTVISADYRKI